MKWKIGKLTRNTLIISLGMGLRSFSQGLVFIIIARLMGADGYGSLVSILAIAGTLGGFIGFGTQVLLTRDITLNPTQFNRAWGQTLISLVLSIPLVFLIYASLAYFILPNSINWIPILMIGIADLIFFPLSNICTSAYQGFERMGRASRMILMPALMRLIAALIFSLVIIKGDSIPLLLTWASLYLSAAIMAASYAQWMVSHELGRPLLSYQHLASKIKESLPFAFWNSSERLYGDADKVMLSRMTTLDNTGIYSAAYRIIDIFIIPINGLITAATPRLFEEGNKSFAHTLKQSGSLFKKPLIYTLLIAVLIYLTADIIPLLIGKDYIRSVEALRYLSLLPIILLPRILMQHILATSGLQAIVMKASFIGGITNIGINVWLIPLWGIKGAIISTYITEIIMTVFMAFIITNKAKQSILKYLPQQ